MSEIESKKSINVESILVYRYQGISPDELFLKTNLPSIWNGDDFKFLIISFYAPHGSSEAYCEKHFPNIPYEVRQF